MPLPVGFERAEGLFHPKAATHTTLDILFDREWALTVRDPVLGRLREYYESEGKTEVFDAVRSTISLEAGKRPLAEVAAHRLRKRYRKLLEETIAETVGSEDSVQEEIFHLMNAFGE